LNSVIFGLNPALPIWNVYEY